MDYSKLLEKAKVAYDNAATGAEKRRLESIFPELAECDEDKIKKELIRYLPYCDDIAKDTKKRWIAWLESIKTQDKQYNSEQDKKMFEIIHDEIFNRMIQFSNGCKKRQEIESAFVWFCETFKLQSNKWSKEDEKMMQYILKLKYIGVTDYTFQNIKIWLESLKKRVQSQQKQEWSDEDAYQIDTILYDLDLRRKVFKERDRYNTQYNWLKSFKDRVQL